MVDFGAFLLVQLLIACALLFAGAALVYRCLASGEWRPRGLADVEEETNAEDRWG